MFNLFVTLLLSVAFSVVPQEYSNSVVITETGNDYMIVEPLGLYQSGYHDIQYRIHKDPEDLFIGDVLSVVMSDNGTDDISDDSVIEYRYTGWIE